MFRTLLATITAAFFALPALAAELVMVEQHGCPYCDLWNEEISGIYPKTAEGKAAPLRRMDIHEDYPPDLTFTKTLTFTPTFVLVEDGQEIARIEGYPGEEFFWWALAEMLRKNTDFEGS